QETAQNLKPKREADAIAGSNLESESESLKPKPEAERSPLERSRDVLVHDKPLAFAQLPDRGVTAIHLERGAVLELCRQVKRKRRPGYVALSDNFQIILWRQLRACGHVEEILDDSVSILAPIAVLERRDIVEDQIGVLRIVLGRVVGIARVPSGVIVVYHLLEFRVGARGLGLCAGLLRRHRHKRESHRQRKERPHHVSHHSQFLPGKIEDQPRAYVGRRLNGLL